jgi:hypothetical protein
VGRTTSHAHFALLLLVLSIRRCSTQAACGWSPYSATLLTDNAYFNQLLSMAASQGCSGTISWSSALTFTLTQAYTFTADLTLDATLTGEDVYAQTARLRGCL